MSFDYSKLATLKPKTSAPEKEVVEETPVVTPVITPVATPVVTPATPPVTTPAPTPVNTPAIPPVETPVATPVTSPVATPVATPVIPLPQPAQPEGKTPFEFLDATHTASEKSVYSVMYRHEAERHWGFKELSKLTGIRSDLTMRRAIDGLIAKQSIEIVSYRHGDPLGPRYRIFAPKEILQRRRKVGIEVDTQTKKIRTPVATPVATPAATPVGTPVATGVKNYGSTPVEITGVLPYLNHVLKYDDDLRARVSSLLPSEGAEAIDRALSEIGSLIADFVERAASRASEPPVRAAYFVKCVKTALAAREAVETTRTLPEPPKIDSGASERSESVSRELLKAVAYEIRRAHRSDPTYTDADLRRDLTTWCAEEGITNGPELIAEVLGV